MQEHNITGCDSIGATGGRLRHVGLSDKHLLNQGRRIICLGFHSNPEQRRRRDRIESAKPIHLNHLPLPFPGLRETA
jgi:hypothetical protein